MSYDKKKSGKEKEEEDDPIETIGKAVGVIAGAAFAAWSIAKLFTGSESSSSKTELQSYGGSDPYAYKETNQSSSFMYSLEGGTLNSEKWSLPKKGWLKLNTDASLKPNPYPSVEAIGGVFRDDQGVWVLGFAQRIRDYAPNIELAELRAIKVGLQIANDKIKKGRDYRFVSIEIETDSEAAVELLDKGKVSDNHRGKLIKECRDLMQMYGFEVKHCPEKANKVADGMANLIKLNSGDLTTTYDTPPNEVVSHLNQDLLFCKT